MIIPLELLEKFQEFLKSLGVACKTSGDQTVKKLGAAELGRFMHGGCFFVIRFPEDTPSEMIEIWSSDQIKRDQLERLWNSQVATTNVLDQMLSEIEKEENASTTDSDSESSSTS